MPERHSKYKRCVREIVEPVSVFSYHLYELLKNMHADLRMKGIGWSNRKQVKVMKH